MNFTAKGILINKIKSLVEACILPVDQNFDCPRCGKDNTIVKLFEFGDDGNLQLIIVNCNECNKAYFIKKTDKIWDVVAR